MQLTASTELWKGLSDILLFVLAFLFAAIIYIKSGQNSPGMQWTRLFFSVGISALLGVIVHIFVLSDRFRHLLWIILLVFMHESSKLFNYRLLSPSRNSYPPRKLQISIETFEIISILTSCIFTLKDSDWDVVLFLIFSVFMLVPVIIDVLAAKSNNALPKILVALLVIAIVCQTLKSLGEVLVSVAHGFIAMALYVLYRIALIQLGSSKVNA